MPVKILREFRPKVREPIVHAAAEPVEDIKVAEEAKPSVASGSAYAVMRTASTYASGAHALRRACEKDPGCIHPTFVLKDGSVVYRPLTFEENIRARLDDYNTLDNPDGSRRTEKNRKRLFGDWLASCTGIAYKKGSTLFKIITESEGLIVIPKNFSESDIPANYSQLQGAELDSRKGTYDLLLTKRQVLKHPAWNAAVADRQLLKGYADLVFRLEKGNNMEFMVRQHTENDRLLTLCVYDIGSNSDAGGGYFRYYGCRFVRATHVAPKAIFFQEPYQ